MRISKAERDAARKTGRIGGKTRAKNLTPEQRSDIARKANAARWAKRDAAKAGGESAA